MYSWIVYKVKEREPELKHASVPNMLFYWIVPFVLQAINSVPAQSSRGNPECKGEGQAHVGRLCNIQGTCSDTFFNTSVLRCEMHWSSHAKTQQDPCKQDAP